MYDEREILDRYAQYAAEKVINKYSKEKLQTIDEAVYIILNSRRIFNERRLL